LYKCPAFLGWDGYSVGSLAEGVSDYRESYRMDAWKRDECLECTYLPLCFGGCRYEALLRDPSADALNCRRELFDATLERLVRQDLRYIHKISP
jgi:uncharacterized protein